MDFYFLPWFYYCYQSQCLTRASQCQTPVVTVQGKCPSAMSPSHQNWYPSQLSWAHSSSYSSLKAVCLIALWVMKKIPGHQSISQQLLNKTPTVNLAVCPAVSQTGSCPDTVWRMIMILQDQRAQSKWRYQKPHSILTWSKFFLRLKIERSLLEQVFSCFRNNLREMLKHNKA